MPRTYSRILIACAVLHYICCYQCMIITLQNQSNFTLAVTPIGAAIQKLLVTDCKDASRQVDVVLGYDDIAGYSLNPHPSFGATVGRVADRISNAQFSLNSETFQLQANDGNSTLHGGAVRWSKVVWSASVSSDKLSATFTRISKDGESGFPGNVRVMVMYSIPPVGTYVNITMQGMSDKATPINMVNHAYFNLKGAGSGDILDHVVRIPSMFYTPNHPGSLLPTGQIFRVRGRPNDFTKPTKIRNKISEADGGSVRGYDVNYVMPQDGSNQQPMWWLPGQNPQTSPDASTKPLQLGAVVAEPQSGLRLRVYTNAPGLGFYTGNMLAGRKSMAMLGKNGTEYGQYSGFSVMPQAFPNAINVPTFPSMVLQPGEMFNNRVSYDFTCS